MLHQLGITNDTPNTAWIKVYDMAELSPDRYDTTTYTSAIKLNIAVPAQSYRDVVMSYGVSFEHGIALRATTDYKYDSPSLTGLGDGAYVYVTCTYE